MNICKKMKCGEGKLIVPDALLLLLMMMCCFFWSSNKQWLTKCQMSYIISMIWRHFQHRPLRWSILLSPHNIKGWNDEVAAGSGRAHYTTLDANIIHLPPQSASTSTSTLTLLSFADPPKTPTFAEPPAYFPFAILRILGDKIMRRSSSCRML